MSHNESLLLVGTIEPVKVGDVLDTTPLHVTVLPWFSLKPKQKKIFEKKSEEIIHNFLPLEIVGEEEAMFGPENDVRVRKISSKAIHLLHNELLGLVEGFGVDMRRVWVGPNYAPHVSYKSENGLKKGETVDLQALQLFSRTSKESMRKVEKVYK